MARTMIAEAGLAALWVAAERALLQLVLAAIGGRATRVAVADGARGSGTPAFAGEQGAAAGILAAVRPVAVVQGALAVLAMGRSEEHTSELQSLMRISYAVFCLTKKQHSKDYIPTSPYQTYRHSRHVLTHPHLNTT